MKKTNRVAVGWSGADLDRGSGMGQQWHSTTHTSRFKEESTMRRRPRCAGLTAQSTTATPLDGHAVCGSGHLFRQ